MFETSVFVVTLYALIAGVKSQKTTTTTSIATCTSTSHQCCWVIRSWQLMGQKTTISSKDNSCCFKSLELPLVKRQFISIEVWSPETRVVCDSKNTKIVEIQWKSLYSKGQIPLELGKLTSLTRLYIPNVNTLEA